jgi:hypothetical protein
VEKGTAAGSLPSKATEQQCTEVDSNDRHSKTVDFAVRLTMSLYVLTCFGSLMAVAPILAPEEQPGSERLQALISELGSSDAAIREAANAKLKAMGVPLLGNLEQALSKAETEFSSVSLRYHLLKKLVTEIGWPGIEELKAHLQDRYGKSLDYFGPAQERLGSSLNAAEKLFPDCRFFAVHQEGINGYEIYAVRQFAKGWKRIARLPPLPSMEDYGEPERTLVELTREESVRFNAEAEVRDFIQVSYLILGAGPPLGCATGIEFRTRVIRTVNGWSVVEEHRNAWGNETGAWIGRWQTTLTLDSDGALLNLDRGPPQPRTDAIHTPQP